MGKIETCSQYVCSILLRATDETRLEHVSCKVRKGLAARTVKVDWLTRPVVGGEGTVD